MFPKRHAPLVSLIGLIAIPVPALTQGTPAPTTATTATTPVYGAQTVPLVGPPASRQSDDDDRRETDAGSDTDTRPSVEASLPRDTPGDIRDLALSGKSVSTFGDAMRLAYWTSPAVLAQRSLLRSYNYRIAEARSAYGPQLSYQLTNGWQRDRLDPTATDIQLGVTNPTTSIGWSNSVAAILTQPIYTFGRNGSAERGARAQRAYEDQVRRSTEQQALLDATAAYAGLLRDRASIGIAADNLAALTKELADNRERLKAHEVTTTDVEQIRERLELGRAALYAARSQTATSEAVFVQKIGLTAAATLEPPPPLAVPVRSLEDAFAFADTHSPVLLAARERERASRAGIQAARANLLPRVDVKGTALYASQTPYDNFARYNEQIVSVVVSGPIYQNGMLQSQMADATAANDSDWRLIDGATRDSHAAIAAAWNDWRIQVASIERFRAAVDAAEKAYAGATRQERAGETTTLEVLQLASDVQTTRTDLNVATATAYLDAAQVLSLMGVLEPGPEIGPDGHRDRYDAQTPYEKSYHKGNLPLLTPLLRAVDMMTLGSNDRRPSRDPGAGISASEVLLDGPGN